MKPLMPIKEEYPAAGGSSSASIWEGSGERQASDYEEAQPRPMEALYAIGPPPFLTKTFEMVDDFRTDDIVSWSRGGHSFVVWDPHEFSTTFLPRYFKHNNFSSFVRQLNTYGFRKIDPDKWEFANESFIRGQKHLLKGIRRRKPTAQQAPLPLLAQSTALEVGKFGLEAEMDSLRRDRQVLSMEVVKLRQQQQDTKAYLQQMEMRLQVTEKKQQHMMSFLAKAMQNPEFIQKLLSEKAKRKELEESISKKRGRPIQAADSPQSDHSDPTKTEPLEFSHAHGFHVSELESLAMEMQGFGKEQIEVVTDQIDQNELDDGFWEELLNEEFDGEIDWGKDGEEGKEEDVNMLADRLGFLGSSPG